MMTKKILYIALILNVISALGLWYLSDIPFGTLFNSFFYVFSICLIVWLAVLSYLQIISKKRWKNIIGYIISFITIAISIVLVLFLIDFRILLNFQNTKQLTNEQWAEDLEYLTSEMQAIHPDLFSMVPESVFNNAVNSLRSNIPSYNDNKIKAEFLKILAQPNDAHTIPNIQSLDLDLHMYPLNLFFFNDGIYVIDAGRGQKDLIGSKLLKIGNHNVDEVYQKLKKYLGSENEYHCKNRLAIILLSEWLMAEGLIENADNVPFEIQNSKGEQKTIHLSPIHYLPYFYWTLIRKVDDLANPVVTNDRQRNYWFEYREADSLLFFQFNACFEDQENPLPEFIAGLSDAIAKKPFNKFVVDIRNNNGGAVNMLHYFSDFIIKNEKINQKGKLFVLTSRKTFSAAVLFASMLERNTNAVFVGEPTAQAPYQRGGGFPKLVTLPNSKLQYFISTTFIHAGFAMDKRLWIAPDVQVPFLVDDFIHNRDATMEAVLNYSIEDELKVSVGSDELEKLKGRYSFSNGHILTISGHAENASLEISDFMDNSLQYTLTDLYKHASCEYVTDIRNVRFEIFPEDNDRIDSLRFCWGDSCRVIHRVADDYKLPMELFKQGDIAQAIREAQKNMDYFRSLSQNMEGYFNAMGYKYLNNDEIKLALQIFEFNVQLYPTSANVYDSLGEAYLKSGSKSLAKKNYLKSLDLNPNNPNAKRVLAQL
jgi:tetratricopeptide (TPR) repeat protein